MRDERIAHMAHDARIAPVARIVVGVDFSEPSTAAVDWVARAFPDADLTLAHCLDAPRVPGFLARRAEPRQRLLELAREGASDRLAAIGHALSTRRVRTEVRECGPVDGLVTSVRAADADLVVVGVTGLRLDGTPRGHMGRTAERLARCAPVPLLVYAGTPRERPRHLLVALDEADITGHVLAWTRTLMDTWDARATAVHVVSSAIMTHVMTMAAAGGASDPEVEARTREEFRDDADGWINEMVIAGLDPARVTSEVDFGEPGQEILAAAARRGADMIVLGSKGAGAVRRAFLGSVVTEVLHWAHCPVLVVVDPDDEPAGG
jgi:nucleotide-binding universal stress UspA family protein